MIPAPGQVWTYKNGISYTVLYLANDLDTETHKAHVVYIGGNGKVWVHRLDQWLDSFSHRSEAYEKLPKAGETWALLETKETFVIQTVFIKRGEIFVVLNDNEFKLDYFMIWYRKVLFINPRTTTPILEQSRPLQTPEEP